MTAIVDGRLKPSGIGTRGFHMSIVSDHRSTLGIVPISSRARKLELIGRGFAFLFTCAVGVLVPLSSISSANPNWITTLPPRYFAYVAEFNAATIAIDYKPANFNDELNALYAAAPKDFVAWALSFSLPLVLR